MGSMTSRLPKEIVDSFAVLDHDKDGTVSIKELQDVMLQVYPKYGVEPCEIADLSSLVLRAADDDQSGVISIEEFASNKQLQDLVKEKISLDTRMRSELQMLKMNQKRAGTADCSKIKSIFDKFDADKSGSLDSKELHGILVKLGADDVTTQETRIILNEIDADKSGRIEFSEFLDWWPTVQVFLKSRKSAEKERRSKK